MDEAIKKAGALIEALPYIQQFKDRIVVVKFGGSAIEEERTLDDVLEDVVFLATVGIRPVLVHGGGKRISQAMREAGLEARFVRGQRVTDLDTLRVVVAVLTEEVNGEILRGIERHGGRAASTFKDGHSLLRARKKLVSAEDEGSEPVDIGFVGEVSSVEKEALLSMAAEGVIVVVPPIAQDGSGQLYNVNADSAAASLAAVLGAEKVVFLTDVHGILADPDDPGSLLSSLDEVGVSELIEKGVISGGMLPKVEACLAALHGGVRKAHIIDGRLEHSLLLEIFTDKGVGTQLLKELRAGAG